MRYLKQSTSVDIPIGPFLDEDDGFTAMTGLTLTQPDIRLKKGAAAWAQKNAAQTLSHEENGNYEVTLDATDTNTLGTLRLHVHETGALPVWEDFMVMPANVWDALFGADALQVHAVEISNGLITAASIADGALTAAKFAAAAFDAVWSVASRLLTAGTNIVLAKGTGVTGLNDLDAAGVRTALGLATANLDTQLSSIEAKTTNLPSDPADQSLVIAATTAITNAIAALNNLSAAQVRTELAVELALLDVAVSSRLATAGYTAPDNAGIAALPSAAATATAVLAAATADPIAANVEEVNAVPIQGTGVLGGKWRPA